MREREHNSKDYELIKCYELLGFECLKAESAVSAIDWFKRAVKASKNKYGESIELADALINLGEAYNKSGQLQESIDQFELAGLMRQKIENQKTVN